MRSKESINKNNKEFLDLPIPKKNLIKLKYFKNTGKALCYPCEDYYVVDTPVEDMDRTKIYQVRQVTGDDIGERGELIPSEEVGYDFYFKGIKWNLRIEFDKADEDYPENLSTLRDLNNYQNDLNMKSYMEFVGEEDKQIINEEKEFWDNITF